MRVALVGTSANRTSETRLLMEMLAELSKKHRVAVLATDVEGQPKAGIVPCKANGAVEEWIETLSPEILITFRPELVVPSFNRVDICVVFESYITSDLEKYDLVCSPYKDTEKQLKDKGFYCIRMPLQVHTKAFANLNLKRKYKTGMVCINPTELVNSTDKCLVLSSKSEPFDILEWSKMLEKEITIITEENDNTLVKFYNSVENCLVRHSDSYVTLHALSCGCRAITFESDEIHSLSPEHIGKTPWVELLDNIERHLGERNKWQKYEIIPQ